MPAPTDSLMSMYNEATAAFAEAQGGFGGDWPSPGFIEAYFTGPVEREGTFWDSESQTRSPCIIVGFGWDWTTPADDRLHFDQTFQIVPNYKAKWPDENSKPHKKARMFMDRYKAAAAKILGRPVGELTNLLAVRNDLAELAARDVRTLAQLEITRREGSEYSDARVVQILAR